MGYFSVPISFSTNSYIRKCVQFYDNENFNTIQLFFLVHASVEYLINWLYFYVCHTSVVFFFKKLVYILTEFLCKAWCKTLLDSVVVFSQVHCYNFSKIFYSQFFNELPFLRLHQQSLLSHSALLSCTVDSIFTIFHSI